MKKVLFSPTDITKIKQIKQNQEYILGLSIKLSNVFNTCF